MVRLQPAAFWIEPNQTTVKIVFTASQFDTRQQEIVWSRGGVEDTKLKAKDTKKFRGQGPRTQS